MEALLAAVSLLVIWMGVELGGRQRVGQRPSSLRELFALLVGKGEMAEREGMRALIFCLFCAMCFALWESILWSLFGREASVAAQFVSVLGVGITVKGLFDGFRRYYWAEPGDVTAPTAGPRLAYFLVGLCLLLGAWISLVLLGPWVAYRFRKRGTSKSRRTVS